MSFGGLDSSRTPNKGNDMIGYGLAYNSDDFNLILSGKTQNISHDDSTNNNDGYAMRITPLGFI